MDPATAAQLHTSHYVCSANTTLSRTPCSPPVLLYGGRRAQALHLPQPCPAQRHALLLHRRPSCCRPTPAPAHLERRPTAPLAHPNPYCARSVALGLVNHPGMLTRCTSLSLSPNTIWSCPCLQQPFPCFCIISLFILSYYFYPSFPSTGVARA